MTTFGRLFQILRIMIPACDDNHVLTPARDEQLAVAYESKIACAQKWSRVRPSQRSLKCRGGFFRPFPIATCHTGTGDPDFAYLSIRKIGAQIGIDNEDSLSTQRFT